MASVQFVHCGVEICAQYQYHTMVDGRRLRWATCPFCGEVVISEVLGEEAPSHD